MDKILELIEANQRLELNKSNKILEPIKSNQGIGLIKLIHYIQSWFIIEHLNRCHDSRHLVTCSITKNGITLNHNSIIYRAFLEAWSISITLTYNIIINILTGYTNNFSGCITYVLSLFVDYKKTTAIFTCCRKLVSYNLSKGFVVN